MNVTKRSQEDIIYLVARFDEITKANIQYLFFDGHGYHHLSNCFNQERDLDKIDWLAVRAMDWHDTEKDPDLKRRKQAEILLNNEIPLKSLAGICVYNKRA